MLNILVDDILVLIVSYLGNKDSHNYVNSSKYLKELFLKGSYGYIKSLKIKNKINDIEKFYFFLSEHLNSINKLEFENVINPQNLIFCKWPKTVILDNCKFTDGINPYLSDTEVLIIKNYNMLKINWKKFPKLKKIILKCNTENYIDHIENIKKYCKDVIINEISLIKI